MPSPYLEREKEGDEAKQAIGAAAALLLKSGEFVVVDAGTTPLAVVRHLPPDLKLTVATHSIPALESLAENPGVECEMIGGRFHKLGRCAVGADTVDGYRKLRPDTCILGASGVHPAAGVTTFPGEGAEVKRSMVANAARVILVILGDRLGTVAPYLTASLSQITRLVTDRGASSESVRALRELGVELTVV
jgi:DeoR/GlpR family transcriptional regulator of sugar metabolism